MNSEAIVDTIDELENLESSLAFRRQSPKSITRVGIEKKMSKRFGDAMEELEEGFRQLVCLRLSLSPA
jgi:hypothetical protein